MVSPLPFYSHALCRFALSTVLLVALSGCGRQEATPLVVTDLPGKGYNVAVILVDTLRPDHLGCYGYDRPTSPRIDALAAEGVVFEAARTASTYTGEAVAALFTGMPPAMSPEGLGWSARPMPLERNLPRIFEAAGYKTGIFSTSFVMRFRGFYDSFQESELFPGVANASALDEDLTTAALAFAERHRNERTFQYLHYYAPHAPYNPPAEFLAPFSIDRGILDPESDIHPAALVSQGMQADDPRWAELKKHYDAEIALVDRAIGRYIDGLDTMGLKDNTIIVILSDHGEEFMEHGFADHAWNLYEETLRIPLVFWSPALFEPGRIADPVSIVDVMPTLLQCLQIPHTPFSGPVSGQYLFAPGTSAWSYVPRDATLYASLFPETRAQLHAVHFDGYSYIAGPRWLSDAECRQFWLLQGRLAGAARQDGFLPLDPWAPVEHEALFDLRADPGQMRNIAGELPGMLEQGRKLLEAYRAAGAPHRKDSHPTTATDPFDQAFIEEQLKALADEAEQPTPAGQDGERLSPEVIDGLETMGYL